MPSSLVERWEANTELDVGAFLERYLTANEPPGYSELADRLRECARLFLETGKLNQAYYGEEE